jgi:DNA processing protein
MGHDPVSVDQLVSLTGNTAEDIMTMLVLLELEGSIASSPGGGYCRLR